MTAENELLDLARKTGKFNSDNALAQRIGVTRAMVSSWRSGRYVMPDEQIAQLCALAKIDGPTWMARIHAERAQTPAEKALWKTALDRLSAAAAVLAVVAVAVHSGAHEAIQAALPFAFVTLPSIHYANFAMTIVALALVVHGLLSLHRTRTCT